MTTLVLFFIAGGAPRCGRMLVFSAKKQNKNKAMGNYKSCGFSLFKFSTRYFAQLGLIGGLLDTIDNGVEKL